MSAEVVWSIISKSSATRTTNKNTDVVFDKLSFTGTGYANTNLYGSKNGLTFCSCADRKNAKIALVKRSASGVSKQYIQPKNASKVIKSQLANYRPDVVKAAVKTYTRIAKANARKVKAAQFVAKLKKQN